MCRPLPLLCVVVAVLLCWASTCSCATPTQPNPISFKYVTINIIDTHAATNTTTYPTLNGTVINLAENNFCNNSVFAAACNSSVDNSNLLLKAVASGMGHETNISVLDIFRCLSIWGPSLCTYDDGYTSVTYNKNQSDMKPNTYTVHILTNYFGCPCSMVKPGNGSTAPLVNSINLAQQLDTLTVQFSQPIAMSKSTPPNTNVPLNTLLTPDGMTRLGTGAIARWKDNMTLVFTVGTKPALTSDLGLLPNIFALFNYPDYFVKSYPPISTADGLGVRFSLTPQDEQVPQVFCNNVTFNIAGLWSAKQQDVAVSIQSVNGTNPATTPYYVLTRVGNTNTTQWKLIIYTTGLPYGSFRLNVTVPSITGGASYSKEIDLWAAGSCKCGQSRPYSECVVCSTNTDCLNGGKCPPPTTNVTNKCICSNFYSGAICQIPPPCGTNSTDQSTCNNRGTCTNQDGGGFQCACSDPVAWTGSRCETVSPNYVYVTLRVLRDFNTLNLTQFKFNFTRDLAAILKINPNLITINNVYAGSTMVDMSFAPDTNNSVPASVIYSRFQNQYSNSNSSLFSALALDPSYTPKPIYGCSASGCPSQPTSPSSSSDDWKLGVGLGVGLGGGLLLLTLVCCCCCRGRHTGTTKGGPPAATATTTTSPAQPPRTNQDVMMVPVKPDEPINGTHEEYKEQDTGGDGGKRTVMFHE